MTDSKRYFSLTTLNFGKHCPATGEDMATALREKAAQLRPDQNWLKAELLQLAADAYETASAASLGHNRSERYQMAAECCRSEAEELLK